MIFKTIIGLLIILIGCSEIQQTPKSGLQIENSPNRGLNYTDPQGTKLSYRYIPITITNDSTIAINIQIALSKEYDYPDEYGEQKFKVFLLPKELTQDKVTYDTISYELSDNELRNYFDKGLSPLYILNETLEPGEKCDITMGTLYPRPTNCGVLPIVLFSQDNRGLYNACDSLINQDISANPSLALGLKLDFYPGSSPEKCTIIPCGQISYPK
ncbi:hypothetical protein OAF63_03820 [Saprospiraceae bacterium]|jgi:hypothetical protein|nr:hypothetical protein [Saprospiraceae bacterium]